MNEQTFLAALHEAPDDEVTWLALADWLDESGQPQRAELVRLGRQVRAMRASKVRKAAVARVAELLLSGVRPAVPEVVNSLGMRLALVPRGRYVMGSLSRETGHRSNEPRRSVEIGTPFYLGVFPVTQAQYEAVMGDNPSHFRADGPGADAVAGLDTADFPVESVTWDEANAFCRQLTQRDRRQSGRAYRLPGEAEWEYACRAAGVCTTAYHVGDSLSGAQANFRGPGGPALGRTCPVGCYAPNALGLYDVHGQVWEWCTEWLDVGHERFRVIRGGNWLSDKPDVCRSAYRGGGEPQSRYYHVGFRVLATGGAATGGEA
jgi:uncharacterized protein (TIGR02996 family)